MAVQQSADTPAMGLKDYLQLIGTAFGLLAGTAALLYISGGAVLALRLWYYQLPVEQPISELPQPLLVTIALTEILLPSAAVAAVYLAVRVMFWPCDPLVWLLEVTGPKGQTRRRGYAVRIAMVLAAVAAALGGIYLWYRSGGGATWNPLFWLLSFGGCALVALVGWRTTSIIHQQHSNTWTSTAAIVKTTLIVGVSAFPIWIVNGGTASLASARACGPSGISDVAVGWLLGETSDRVYFGGMSPDNGGYVAWVPSKNVTELVINTNKKPAARLSC